MFGIFKKKQNIPAIDLSQFGVDMHSHLIPGIDDGSRSMDETIAMLAKFQDLGFKKVITTPHTMSDFYRNTPGIILEGLRNVQNTAKELGLTIGIEAASEYYFDDAFVKKIANNELLTFGNNYVLLEFSMRGEPMFENQMFFELIKHNYKPVLAHFERYSSFFGSVEKAKEYRERGVLIQMNLNSLTGHYGIDVKLQAEKLVDAKLVDFVGTDCHRMEHLLILESHLHNPYFHKLLDLNLLNRQLM